MRKTFAVFKSSVHQCVLELKVKYVPPYKAWWWRSDDLGLFGSSRMRFLDGLTEPKEKQMNCDLPEGTMTTRMGYRPESVPRSSDWNLNSRESSEVSSMQICSLGP